MTVAEKQKFRETAQRMTLIISSLRDQINTLKTLNDDMTLLNERLATENLVLRDLEKYCRYRIIELKGDLSAKNIEIRRLENEILRLKMIIDEKA